MKLTKLEIAFIKSFVSKLYAEPGFSDVDANDFASEYSSQQQLGGIMSSLEQKGIIWVERGADSGCDYDIIYLISDWEQLHPEWAKYNDAEYIDPETLG